MANPSASARACAALALAPAPPSHATANSWGRKAAGICCLSASTSRPMSQLPDGARSFQGPDLR
eukprot:1121029-Alexandrium_andersonii.AAC.1